MITIVQNISCIKGKSLGLFFLIFAVFFFPDVTLANPGKTTTCLNCHNAENTGASIFVAVEGAEWNTASNYVLSSYTGSALDVEIDYVFKNNTEAAGGETVALMVSTPSGWPITPGTVNSPTGTNFGANWSSAWDIATSNLSTTETYYTVSTGDTTYYPNSPDNYSIYWFDITGSGWDGGRNKGAFDDASAGDLDGMAETMGTDFRITVPAGLTAGTTHQIVVLGIGHLGSSKSYVHTTLTLEIPSGGGDIQEPTSAITDPTNGADLNSSAADPYTITGTASDNDAVSLVEVSINSGAWQTATDTGGGTPWSTWSYSWTLPADGPYTIQSRATDASSNQEGAGAGNGGISVTVDRTTPSVSTTVPSNGAPAVTLNSNVTINWDEPVDCATVDATSITSDSPGWTFSTCSGSQAVFTTSGQANSTTYNVTVSVGVTDVAGNPMTAPYNFSYTTEAPVCSYVTPTVTIDTVNQQITSDGGTATYTVTVFNNDPAICSSTAFNLVASDTNSTDFALTSFSLNPLTVAPQSNVQTTMTVAAQVGGGNGTTNDTFFYTQADVNHAQSDNSTTVTTLINIPRTAATHYNIGETAHFEFQTDTQFVSTGAGALTITDSSNTPILSSVNMLEVQDVAKWIYTYDWDTTGQSAGYYQLEIADSDGVPVARASIVLDYPPDQINFFSDATYTTPADIFAQNDVVYVEVKMATSAFSINTSTLNSWTGTSATTTNNNEVTGTTYRFDFTVDFVSAGIANTDWGYYVWEGDNGVTLQRAVQRNDAGCGTCTYADPTIAVITGNQNILTDGGSVDYTIEITNNDSPACGSTSFDLVAVDSNITNFNATTFGSDPFAVAPGTTGSTAMTVSGIAGQPHGSFNDTYFYTAADANHGQSFNSSTVTTTIVDQTPPTFGGLTAANDLGTGGAVSLSWNAATDVNPPITYNIYWATTSGGQNFLTLNSTSSNGTGDTITGLNNNQIYYFVVRAIDSIGNEDTNTNEFSATPTAPPDFDPPLFGGLTSATDSGTGGSVILTWNAATDDTLPITYNIYWATASGSQNFTTPNVTSGSNTGDTVTGLTNGQIYYFVVRAKDAADNEETNTVEFSATPTDATVPVFGGLSSATDTATDGQVTLSWTVATDSSPPITYNIYWATTSGGQNFGAPNATSSSGLGTTIGSLSNGQIYYFVVRAKDNFGNEDSNAVEFSATPTDATVPVFGGLSSAADAATDGQVTLSWAAATDSSPPITYNIYWATTSGGQNFGAPNTTSSSGTGTTVSGLTNGQIYYFVVRAQDNFGNENSNAVEFSATPTDAASPVFGGLSSAADAATDGQVTLSWSTATDSSPPITYNIYWATTSGGQNFGAPNTTSSSGTGTTVSGLTNGQIYYFVVRAEDSFGNEDTNALEFSATPTDGIAPTFAGLTNAVKNLGVSGAVDLTWTLATDTSPPITYNIYWSTTSGGQNFGTPNTTSSSGTGTTVSGLTNGQIYYFVVRAQDSFGNEDTNTIEFSATPDVPDTTPPVFGGVTSASDAITDGEVVLGWAAATDDTPPIIYNIYWSFTPGGQNFGSPNATTSSGTGTTVGGLINDQTYYFVVRAEDLAGNEETNTSELAATPTLAPDSGPPADLIDLAIVPAGTGDNYLSLTWTAPGDDGNDPGTYAASYDLRYATEPIDGVTWSSAIQYTNTPVPSVQGTAEMVVVDGLQSNTTYYFALRTSDEIPNVSGLSNVPIGKTGLLYGWNMVSCPLITGDSPSIVFGDDAGYDWMWAWAPTWDGAAPNPENFGDWVTATNADIQNGNGIYIYSMATSQPTDANGSVNVAAQTTISLTQGYNIISSSFSDTVNLSDCSVTFGSTETYATAVSNGWIGNALYIWDGSTYVSTTWDVAVLEPWKAYYVIAYENMDLIVPNPNP